MTEDVAETAARRLIVSFMIAAMIFLALSVVVVVGVFVYRSFGGGVLLMIAGFATIWLVVYLYFEGY